jgi:Right handed beta helix region
VRGIRLAVLIAALALAAFPATAAARTVACGEVITQSTAVDNDLICDASSGLVIGANGVRLDLRGHTIQTTADRLLNSGFTGIDAQGHDDVVIRNGSAFGSGFFPGIWVNGSRNRVVDVTAFGETSFVVSGAYNVLRHVSGFRLRVFGNNTTVSSSSGLFPDVSGTGHRIVDDDLRGALIRGDHVTLARNLVPSIRVAGDDNRVIRNRRVASLVLSGADRNFVAHNQIGGPDPPVSFDGPPGLQVGLEDPAIGNAIVDNVVSEVADLEFPGIWVGAGSVWTQVLRNRSESNPGDGILIEEHGTLVRGNVANGNGKLGINAPGVSDGGGNRAAGNADARQCVGVICR